MQNTNESEAKDRSLVNAENCQDIMISRANLTEQLDRISVQLESIGMALVKIGKLIESKWK